MQSLRCSFHLSPSLAKFCTLKLAWARQNAKKYLDLCKVNVKQPKPNVDFAKICHVCQILMSWKGRRGSCFIDPPPSGIYRAWSTPASRDRVKVKNQFTKSWNYTELFHQHVIWLRLSIINIGIETASRVWRYLKLIIVLLILSF